MVIRQGIDIVHVPRFRMLAQMHVGLINEIFTRGEQDLCFSRRDPYTHLAARFAAKEACMKALGKGINEVGIDGCLQEIEVIRTTSGKPELVLSGWMSKVAGMRAMDQLTLSLSHSSDYAVAAVILTGKQIPRRKETR